MAEEKEKDTEEKDVLEDEKKEAPETEDKEALKAEEEKEETAAEPEAVSAEEKTGETSEDPEKEEEEAKASEAPAEDEKEGEGEKHERKLNWAKKEKAPPKKTKEDILTAQLAEEKDKYTRLIAEFDNFRKRNEKEKDAMYDFGAKSVIEKILPVLDNFERGLAALPEEEKDSSFAQGMDKTYKQFQEILTGLGVKPIEAVGKEFNPDLHSAVMHVDDESVGENIVVEEFQKGYTYKDKLVRPSMVKVAN